MTTLTELAKGLAGAIGSDFRSGNSQLLFVEYGGNLSSLTLSPTVSYTVLGTGYNQPEDVKAGADGTHCYVIERAGDLLRVAYATPDRASAAVISSGMTAPQQMFLDELNNAAYVVEYAASGRLLRINLTSGAQTVLLAGLDNAVGLTLSASRQFAYISEQTSGPDLGRVSSFQLSNGYRQSLATGLTSPFMLTWADAAQSALYVPERDPANRLTRVSVGAPGAHVAVAGLPVRPSSVTMISPGKLLACCDQMIDEISFSPAFEPDGLLVPSIGFIPRGWITSAGLADTTGPDPSYFYQVENVPFGGSLPVMVNYARAAHDGASHYRVKVDGNVRTDQFNGAKVSGGSTVAATITPQTLAGHPGYYPVLSSTDLADWIPDPPPGCYLDSTSLTSGELHTIVVDFFDASLTHIKSSAPLKIFVDNNRCVASISMPTLDGSPANACGYLPYIPGLTPSEEVSIAFTASQPEGFATYSFEVIKGAGTLMLSQGGPVSSVVSPVTDSAAALLGGCLVAAFAAEAQVAASASSGWSRQSQYDASALIAFALAPRPS
jgi:hypothetical protein